MQEPAPYTFLGEFRAPDRRPWHCVICSKTLGTIYIGQDAKAAGEAMQPCMGYGKAATRGDAEKLAAIAAGRLRSNLDRN